MEQKNSRIGIVHGVVDRGNLKRDVWFTRGMCRRDGGPHGKLVCMTVLSSRGVCDDKDRKRDRESSGILHCWGKGFSTTDGSTKYLTRDVGVLGTGLTEQ